MLDPLLPILPVQISSAVAWIVLIGCAVLGLVLWTTGARFGRSWITLILVATGALVGKMLPKWFGWVIDPMGPTVACAVVLGLLGYLLYPFWIGIGTGVLLALWAGLGLWLALAPMRGWTMPDIDHSKATMQEAVSLWQQLPRGYTGWAPYWAGVSLLCGAAGTLLWPRIGTALLYSMAGLTSLLGAGLIAINVKHPDWLKLMPAPWVQCTVLGCLLAAGALLQDRLAHARTQEIQTEKYERSHPKPGSDAADDE